MNKDYLCVEAASVENNEIHTSFPIRKLKRVMVIDGGNNLAMSCKVNGDVIEMDPYIAKDYKDVLIYYYKDGGICNKH